MQHNLVFKVLDVLSDGKFHSGESIAKTFDISRVSIWNAIKKAEEFGVEIYSVRGRGYKLIQPIMLLKKPSIEQVMGEIHHWFNLEIFDVMDSTNSYLMEKASLGHPHASVAATHIQTKGRGRRGRSWQSALGESLTFSLLWRFNGGAATLSGLSLAVGVAIIRSLHRFGVLSAQLKWPNDVLVQDGPQYKKLAGILIELQGDMEGQSTAVIGIGINLNQVVFSENLPNPVSLRQITGKSFDGKNCAQELIGKLSNRYYELKENGFNNLHSSYLEHLYKKGDAVRLKKNAAAFIATIDTVTAQGELIITHGITESIQFGEIEWLK
ncbi:MAG: hypothetical protein RIR23_810 [Pseudomonadota bacterium]